MLTSNFLTPTTSNAVLLIIFLISLVSIPFSLVSDNGDETATAALDGICSALDGSSAYFEMEYPCNSPSVKRWFLMTVSPFKGLKGGVIVAHINITSRKMAETKIEQLKNQLEAESAYLQDEIKLEHNFENIIGQSEALKYVLHRLEQVAPPGFSRADYGGNRHGQRADGARPAQAQPSRQTSIGEGELCGPARGID